MVRNNDSPVMDQYVHCAACLPGVKYKTKKSQCFEPLSQICMLFPILDTLISWIPEGYSPEGYSYSAVPQEPVWFIYVYFLKYIICSYFSEKEIHKKKTNISNIADIKIIEDLDF